VVKNYSSTHTPEEKQREIDQIVQGVLGSRMSVEVIAELLASDLTSRFDTLCAQLSAEAAMVGDERVAHAVQMARVRRYGPDAGYNDAA
jgi:hypothetical protein